MLIKMFSSCNHATENKSQIFVSNQCFFPTSTYSINLAFVQHVLLSGIIVKSRTNFWLIKRSLTLKWTCNFFVLLKVVNQVLTCLLFYLFSVMRSKERQQIFSEAIMKIPNKKVLSFPTIHNEPSHKHIQSHLTNETWLTTRTWRNKAIKQLCNVSSKSPLRNPCLN